MEKISPDEEAEKPEKNKASGTRKNNRDHEKLDQNPEEISSKVKLKQKECLCEIL